MAIQAHLRLDDQVRTAESMLRVRTYLYGTVAALMLVVSLGGRLDRFVALLAFTLAISAPLILARRDPVRRIEIAVVSDLAGAFILWWSMQQAPIVSLLLVLWAVSVTVFLPRRRTAHMLLLLAFVLELAKVPIVVLERAGWFPWTPAGHELVDPFSLVVSAGGETVLVVVAIVVFRALSGAHGRLLQATQASERHLRAIFDSRVAAMVLFDADGGVIDVNEAAIELVGLPAESMLGNAWLEMVAPADRREIIHFVMSSNPSEGWMRREISLEAGGGRELWIEVTVARLQESSAVNEGLHLAHLQDVTERHLTEAALRESEIRYRRFFEQLPVAMYRTMPDGAILDGNQALAELLGVESPAVLQGRNARAFYADPAHRDELSRRLSSDGEVTGYEYQLRRPDGEIIWVRDSARLVTEQDPPHYEGALVDVTERKEAEIELITRARQQEAVAGLGRLALENTDAVVAVERATEVVGEVLELDAAYAFVTDTEGSVGLVAAAGRGADLREDEASVGAERVLSGRSWQRRGEDASRRAVLIPGPTGPYGVVVALGSADVTLGVSDVIFLEAVTGVLGAAIERSRARRRLERLIASKDEFIASISHEVRTPLTVVAGMADELATRWEGFRDDEIRELVAIIVDQSREMEDLIEDLLVAARADIGNIPVRMQEIVVDDEINQVIGSLAAARSRTFDVATSGAVAYADPIRLRQIVRNLVTNAIRYGGDTISIDVEIAEETVAIRVIDDGSGVPDGARDRIFEPYERAHAEDGRPGSVGLGLAVSRKLAELMGGALCYRYDDLSIFELTLARAVVPSRLS